MIHDPEQICTFYNTPKGCMRGLACPCRHPPLADAHQPSLPPVPGLGDISSQISPSAAEQSRGEYAVEEVRRGRGQGESEEAVPVQSPSEPSQLTESHQEEQPSEPVRNTDAAVQNGEQHADKNEAAVPAHHEAASIDATSNDPVYAPSSEKSAEKPSVRYKPY